MYLQITVLLIRDNEKVLLTLNGVLQEGDSSNPVWRLAREISAGDSS